MGFRDSIEDMIVSIIEKTAKSMGPTSEEVLMHWIDRIAPSVEDKAKKLIMNVISEVVIVAMLFLMGAIFMLVSGCMNLLSLGHFLASFFFLFGLVIILAAIMRLLQIKNNLTAKNRGKVSKKEADQSNPHGDEEKSNELLPTTEGATTESITHDIDEGKQYIVSFSCNPTSHESTGADNTTDLFVADDTGGWYLVADSRPEMQKQRYSNSCCFVTLSKKHDADTLYGFTSLKTLTNLQYNYYLGPTNSHFNAKEQWKLDLAPNKAKIDSDKVIDTLSSATVLKNNNKGEVMGAVSGKKFQYFFKEASNNKDSLFTVHYLAKCREDIISISGKYLLQGLTVNFDFVKQDNTSWIIIKCEVEGRYLKLRKDSTDVYKVEFTDPDARADAERFLVVERVDNKCVYLYSQSAARFIYFMGTSSEYAFAEDAMVNAIVIKQLAV